MTESAKEAAKQKRNYSARNKYKRFDISTGIGKKRKSSTKTRDYN